ncbi:MAG: DM13 domain-containing protein [Egibacteraceae bacterium]
MERSARKAWLLVAAVAAVVVVAVVLVWFQPQTLLFDREAAEELPGVVAGEAATEGGAGGGAGGGAEGGAGGGAVTFDELARGAFAGFTGKHGTGTARLLANDDGTHLVRFEDLDTSNGPDLRVYLSAAPADGDEAAHDVDFVDLGELTANRGDQNYPVPAEIDVTRFRSVVVWCRRFSVGFAAAPLE